MRRQQTVAQEAMRAKKKAAREVEGARREAVEARNYRDAALAREQEAAALVAAAARVEGERVQSALAEARAEAEAAAAARQQAEATAAAARQVGRNEARNLDGSYCALSLSI